MGAVDLVVQVESPPSVASGLQRVGRAGHQVGAVSTGVVFPKYRGDLVQAAVVTERMRHGRDRGAAGARQPAGRAGPADRRDGRAGHLGRRRAAGRGPPGRARSPRCRESAFTAVLDMLAGRYPSDAFAELRPRLVWDRVAGTVTGRPGRAAARGHLRRHHPGPRPVRRLPGRRRPEEGRRPGRRAGRGDGLRVPGRRRLHPRHHLLADRGHHPRPGAGLPRARRAGQAAVLEGRPARPPAGAGPGGRRVPARGRRACRRRTRRERLRGRRARRLGGGQPAVATWTSSARPAATCPDDRTIVVERFRDELGDWRVVVHSPFGAQVHAPWALALGARLRRAVRPGRPGDARRRRHRAAAAGRRPDGLDLLDAGPAPAGRGVRRPSRPGRRGGRRLRPGRDRAARHRPGRRLRAVRLPVPRVRRPRAAAAAPQSRQAHPAVAAAPARRPTAAGGHASSARSRSSWRRSASASRTSSTCRA